MRDARSNWMRGGCAIALAGSVTSVAAAGVIERFAGPMESGDMLTQMEMAAASDRAPESPEIRIDEDAFAAMTDAHLLAPRLALAARASAAARGFGGWVTDEMAARAAARASRPATWNGEESFAAEVKYFEDFEGRSLGREWAVTHVTAMEGFSRFAGPFRNQASTVHVAVTEGQSYMLSVDICFIATRLGTPDASDLLRITVDGEIRFEEHISTLVAERAALRAEDPSVDATIFPNLIVPFRADYSIAEIVIEGVAAGEMGGEMWGFDNVMIDTTPKLMASVFGTEGVQRSPGGGGGGGFSPGAGHGGGRSFGPGAFSEGPGATYDPTAPAPKFPFIDSNPFIEDPQDPLLEPTTPEIEPVISTPPNKTDKNLPPTEDEPPVDRELPPDVPAPGVLMVAPMALVLGLRRKR